MHSLTHLSIHARNLDFTCGEGYCDRLEPQKIEEMEINPVWLARWGKVEDGMRGFAHEYRREGKVAMFDIFVADALPIMKSYKIWRTHVMPG